MRREELPTGVGGPTGVNMSILFYGFILSSSAFWRLPRAAVSLSLSQEREVYMTVTYWASYV